MDEEVLHQHSDQSELSPEEIGPRAVVSNELCGAIAAAYGLGTIQTVQDVGGTYNLNLRLQTSSGAYIVRVYRPWVTRERLETPQRTRNFLARAGFPAVTALPTTSGETSMRIEDRLVEVERWVVHDGIADSWQRYARTFATLGRLHDLLAQGIDEHSIVPPRVSNYALPETLLRRTEQVASAIGHAVGSDATRALTICRDVACLLSEIQQWWEKVGVHLPVQCTHGDFGGGNNLFCQERVVAVIDFDFLAVGERLFDIAYCLYWMCVRPGATRDLEHCLRDQGPAMLAAYNCATTRPLTPAETEALPVEIARVPLYWVAEAHFLPDPVGTLLALSESVNSSKRVLARRDALARCFQPA